MLTKEERKDVVGGLLHRRELRARAADGVRANDDGDGDFGVEQHLAQRATGWKVFDELL